MSRRVALPALLLVALVAPGCGGGGDDGNGGGDAGKPPVLGRPSDQGDAAQALGFPGFATKNTTRVGGADPIADAAAVAQAVYPARSRETRPPAVTIVDARDWRAAISAAQLLSPPLRSPILFSQERKLPPASAGALERLQPRGAKPAGRAQVIRVGDAAAEPKGFKSTAIEGADFAALARAVDRLHTAAAGEPSDAVIVAPAGAPAFAMPAAGLAAKSGTPVLWTQADRLPPATRQAITDHRQPAIYVLGPERVISEDVVEQLRRLGTVQRIQGPDPVRNAIAFARYANGRFGWNVVDPGHGLVFANARRTQDAAAAAPLSASGTYGPLLLVSGPNALPAPLESYLLDIQPGYDRDPVRGVYNHGWLMGDEEAISVDVQSRIDALLEIQSVQAGE